MKSGQRLDVAVASACLPTEARGSSVAIRRTGGRSPYIVSLYPLVQRRRFLAPFGAAALVCIVDPSARYEGLPEHQVAMLA